MGGVHRWCVWVVCMDMCIVFVVRGVVHGCLYHVCDAVWCAWVYIVFVMGAYIMRACVILVCGGRGASFGSRWVVY